MHKNFCKIGLDAMGGDDAPKPIVEGAKLAVDEFDGEIYIILVGNKDEIEKASPDIVDYKDSISIVHTDVVVDMCDSPMSVLKEKKNSSLNMTAQLLKTKEADAVVSAGNTGAFMAASLFSAGKIKGVARPTIGTIYPRKQDEGFLLDVGANTDCKPHHLYQFGVMGATFLELSQGLKNPKIGLLNVGEEPSKGNAASVETYKLFNESALNFVGNIEGRDIFRDKADIVVCDGFTGNILLKLFETLPGWAESLIESNIDEGVDRSLFQKPLDKIHEKYNYENYGGLPLLGLNGISIIGHGHSSAAAIKTAVVNAYTMHKKELHIKISENIDKYRETTLE